MYVGSSSDPRVRKFRWSGNGAIYEPNFGTGVEPTKSIFLLGVAAVLAIVFLDQRLKWYIAAAAIAVVACILAIFDLKYKRARKHFNACLDSGSIIKVSEAAYAAYGKAIEAAGVRIEYSRFGLDSCFSEVQQLSPYAEVLHDRATDDETKQKILHYFTQVMTAVAERLLFQQQLDDERRNTAREAHNDGIRTRLDMEGW